MQKMVEEEWRRFAADGPKTGKLSTIGFEGKPHCVPVWWIFEGDNLVFMTMEASQKARNIERDARVSLTVDSEEFPYDFVTIEGTAQIKHVPLDDLFEISQAIAFRYVPAGRVDEFAARNAVEGEVVVIITPQKVISAKGVAG